MGHQGSLNHTVRFREIIAQRIVLPVAALFLTVVIGYWALWEFYVSRRDKNPFDPETAYDVCLRVTFGPIERFERDRKRRLALPEKRRAMQGSWKFRIFYKGSTVEASITIVDDMITFDRARSWPEIHGRSFAIQTDEPNWSLYFETEYGRTTLIPPTEDYSYNSDYPDKMAVKGVSDGGWPYKRLVYLMQRVPKESNDSKE